MQKSGCPCSRARDVKNFTACLVRKKWPRYKEQNVRKISLRVAEDATRILAEEELRKSRRNSIGAAVVPLREEVLKKFISRHLEDLVSGTYKRDITVAQVYQPAKKNLSDEQKCAVENKLHLALYEEERQPPPVKRFKQDTPVPSFRLLHTISEVEEETQKGQIDSLIRRLSGIGIQPIERNNANEEINKNETCNQKPLNHDAKTFTSNYAKKQVTNQPTCKKNTGVKTTKTTNSNSEQKSNANVPAFKPRETQVSNCTKSKDVSSKRNEHSAKHNVKQFDRNLAKPSATNAASKHRLSDPKKLHEVQTKSSAKTNPIHKKTTDENQLKRTRTSQLKRDEKTADVQSNRRSEPTKSQRDYINRSHVETDDTKMFKVRKQKRSIDAIFGVYYGKEDSYFRELQQLSAQFQEMQKQLDRIRMFMK